MSLFLTLAIISILTLLLWFFLRRRPNIIPGPNSFLSTLKFAFDPFKMSTVGILEYARKYPRVYPMNLFAGTVYIVHDPKLVKEIVLDKGQELVNHTRSDRMMVHPEKFPIYYSLFSIRDDVWRKRRKALSPHFNLPKILPLVELFRKHTDVLCDILTKLEGGGIVNLQQKFANITVDILGDSVFGSQFNSQVDPSNSIAKAVNSFVSGLGNYQVVMKMPYWYKYPLPQVQRFLKGIDYLMDLCRQIVRLRKEQRTTHNDLLQGLIDLNLDLETALIPESFLFLIAGHETTANFISWAVCMIAQHPDVEKKIVEEINKVLGPHGEPTADNIESLEYLDCVLHETLRLYSPAVFSDREITKETIVDGIKFPANSSFMIPIWAIHHNEKYWPNPEKFDPTRFDSEHKQNIVPFSWLPFGGGPRICLGTKFALVEGKVILSKLYQKFSFQVTEPVVTILSAGLLKPEKLMVKVQKR